MLASIGTPYVPSWSSTAGLMLGPFAAELVLVGTMVAVLLAPFFATRRSNIVSGLVALTGFIVALACVILVGALLPEASGSAQFRGMLVSDPYALLWKVMLLLFAAGVVLMWFSTTAGLMHEGDGPEFFTLLVGATLGMCLMASTTNLLMIFMAVELASFPSYVLAGFRKTDRVGSEASLKYVLFGAACSSVMVYGMSMLYGAFGTLQVEQIAAQLRGVTTEGLGVPVIVGIAGLIVGIGFKISAVPLHFWCPDVFEGAGVDVSVFLSVASKGAGLSLLLRVLMTLADGVGYDPSATVVAGTAVAVGILGAITATVGNAGALVQNNVKRLLAYSSIAHAGYMLCALALLVRGADGAAPMGAVATAILLYLAVYLFMNLGAFTVAGLIYRRTGSEDIRDYAALGRRNPILALSMAAFMFSLVGLPPFAGFVAKLNVMVVLGRGGGWLWALVAVIGVNTIVSLYYYARVVRVMYLEESDEPALEVNPVGAALSAGCAAVLVLMLLLFSPLLRLAERFGSLYVASPAAAAAAGLVGEDRGAARAGAQQVPVASTQLPARPPQPGRP